jgi:transglycosylase-like protein
MSEWTDDVETEEEPARRHDMKRAVLGGVAGVALLVGPIALANAVVPDGGNDDVKTEDQASQTSLVALKQMQTASDAARLSGGLSLRTTTTTAPPTTTTTAPPTTTTTAPPTTTTTAPPETTDPPTPVDPPPDSGGGLGDPYDYASWDALAQCESGGNWQINTGNGYYGGLQFSLSSWQAVGGTGYPNENSRETQIAMGIRLWESSGWGAWPACSSELGYR